MKIEIPDGCDSIHIDFFSGIELMPESVVLQPHPPKPHGSEAEPGAVASMPKPPKPHLIVPDSYGTFPRPPKPQGE